MCRLRVHSVYGRRAKGAFFSSVLLFVAVTSLPFSSAFANKAAVANEYKTIEWPDLIPEEDLDALLNPPEYLADIEDGSAEDQISSQITSAIAAATKKDRYQQALVSTKIRPEMNGRDVRIPGFIVPLEFSDDQVITEFFLVPFFGACIHVPPPPPNQIIYVKHPKGFKVEALYEPFWLSGLLRTTLIENEVASAAYTMEVHTIDDYSES